MMSGLEPRRKRPPRVVAVTGYPHAAHIPGMCFETLCLARPDLWHPDRMEIMVGLKLAGVAFLVYYHIQCGRYVYAINEDSDQHSHVFYRFFNEVPVVFLFAIVILAVLKPW